MIARHEREIFPLMKRRSLFSGSADFVLYDLFVQGKAVNENVFVYSNRHGNDRSLVLYNKDIEQEAKGNRIGGIAPPRNGNFGYFYPVSVVFANDRPASL